MHHPHIPATLLAAFVAITLAGCRNESQLASQLPTPTGPIAVQAHVDESDAKITSSLNGNDPDVTIQFGGDRKIVITESRILVDNEAYPPAPPGTKTIGIDVANGQVTLTADGTPITK